MAAQPARRSALRRLAVGALGLSAVAAGLIAWGSRRPEARLLSLLCQAEGGPVKRKVLVAYATRAGSTAEVAQAIGERLCALGFDADVRPVREVQGLQGYQAVVLGSAIRYGAWLPEMVRLVQAQRAELAALPLAIFTLHMQALADDAASRETRAGYTKAILALVSPREEAFFAGQIDLARLSFFERLAVKMVKSPVGDRRDWQRISAWVDTLAQRLP